MNAILERADDMLLNAAQSVSDLVHRTTGIGNWSIALTLLRIGLGVIMLSQALTLRNATPLHFAIAGVLSLLWFAAYNMCGTRLQSQRSSRDAGRAVRVSERRLRTKALGMNMLVVVILSTVPTVSNCLVIVAMAVFHLHYCFKAADLPPPSTSGKTAAAH